MTYLYVLAGKAGIGPLKLLYDKSLVHQKTLLSHGFLIGTVINYILL